MMRKISGTTRHRMLRYQLATLGLAVLIVVGCYKSNPFTAAQFNQTLPGVPVVPNGGNGNANANANGNDNTQIYEFLDDIPTNLRTIQSGFVNSATVPVRHRKLFVVTAGDGGFVRNDADVADYLAAGYRDLVPPNSPVGTTATVGCVSIRLLRGTRLLGKPGGLQNGSDVLLPANTTGDPTMFTGPQVDTRDDNQSQLIPLPEFIVFATDNPAYDCTNDTLPCTQETFQYFDTNMSQMIGKQVTAARVQGTVCNAGLGQSPESRLDKTVDGQVSSFQYVPGATIVWRVLDRQFDGPTNNRVQVVWTVVDADDNVIHAETP